MGKNVKDMNVVLENIHPLSLESVFLDYKSTLNKKACFYLKPLPIIIQKQIFQKPAYFKLWFLWVLFREIYSWILKKKIDDTWYFNFECPWENFGSLILKLPLRAFLIGCQWTHGHLPSCAAFWLEVVFAHSWLSPPLNRMRIKSWLG